VTYKHTHYSFIYSSIAALSFLLLHTIELIDKISQRRH